VPIFVSTFHGAVHNFVIDCRFKIYQIGDSAEIKPNKKRDFAEIELKKMWDFAEIRLYTMEDFVSLHRCFH
jgi:hypothetical protein